MFDPKTSKALEQLSEALAEESPEAADVLDKLRNGYTSEVEAIRQLMEIPGIGETMERLAGDAFASLREESGGDALNPLTIFTGTGVTPTGEEPPVIVQETGLPRLNPLVEAAIAERATIDGDVPELRSGPMPEGAEPAVPVESDVRDPVALGSMLKTASDEVASEMAEATAEHSAKARKLLETVEEQGMEEDRALALYKDNLPGPPTGVQGYEAGQVPAPRQVGKPSGSALAAMPPEERQQAAYKALSTSQGRRSAVRVLEELIQVGLRSEGYDFETQPPSVGAKVLVYAQWEAKISGPLATQSNFSFIDTAAKALLLKLVPLLGREEVSEGVLEVDTVDSADMRSVGWAARVVGR
jgi:hypothetical protein